jgi:hypothetical protein
VVRRGGRKKEIDEMAQGQFTKQEADSIKAAVDEIFDALPRKKRLDFLGDLNDILLFIHAAREAAPNEAEAKDGK